MKRINSALLAVVIMAGALVLPLSLSIANVNAQQATQSFGGNNANTKTFKCDTAKECKAIFEKVSGNVVIEFTNSGSGGGTIDNETRAKNTQQDQQLTALETENTGLKSQVAGLNATVSSQQSTIASQGETLNAVVAQNTAQDGIIASMNATLQDVITGIQVNQTDNNTGGNTTIPPVVCVDPQVLNTTSNTCETPIVPPVICEPPSVLNATSNQCETPVVIPPVDNGTGNQTGNGTGTGGGTGNQTGNETGGSTGNETGGNFTG